MRMAIMRAVLPSAVAMEALDGGSVPMSGVTATSFSASAQAFCRSVTLDPITGEEDFGPIITFPVVVSGTTRQGVTITGSTMISAPEGSTFDSLAVNVGAEPSDCPLVPILEVQNITINTIPTLDLSVTVPQVTQTGATSLLRTTFSRRLPAYLFKSSSQSAVQGSTLLQQVIQLSHFKQVLSLSNHKPSVWRTSNRRELSWSLLR